MAIIPHPTKAIDVFFSYAHEDEQMRDRLEKHLAILKRQGMINSWHDRKIFAGEEWADRIDEQINIAGIILLLVSADFLASDYCYNIEMECALNRHKNGEARVIPIILHPCDWQGAPFGRLQALPEDAKAITSWSNPEEAYLSIAQGIRRAVEVLAVSPETSMTTITNQVHEGTNSQSSPSGVRWMLELDGTIDDVNKHRALAIIIRLQKLLNDQSLRLIEIKSGSIVLVLEGSHDGFERMKHLVQSGQLDKLLGLGIQRVFEAQEVEPAGNQPRERSTSIPTLKKLTIYCADSLELLSEYYDGALDEMESMQVRTHLQECIACMAVLQDLEAIILAAAFLKNVDDISFPDENMIWHRLGLDKKIAH